MRIIKSSSRIQHAEFAHNASTDSLSHQMTTIHTDWHGLKTTINASFAICIDERSIHFTAKAHSPSWQQNSKFKQQLKGQFTEGLWNNDVAELFICDDNQPNTYQEFNLSPQGAWWTCLFSSPRELATQNSQLHSQIQTKSIEPLITTNNTNNTWHVTMSYPLSGLLTDTKFNKQTRLNVCFIVGQDPRHYLTHTPLHGDKPDFHQPQFF